MCSGIIYYSCACNISSGLLQGNILSPKFFNAYMDELLYKLEESGLGCKLYNMYCGILMYADDILLLCSSITKFQLMVDICVSFGIEIGVTFSLLKSNCFAIYPDKIHFSSSSIQLGGISLNWSNKLRYLGIFITNNSKNLFDLNEQIGKFYAAIYSIISKCGVNKELVALELLKRKCAPILFYALDAISINNKIRDIICKVWNASIRLIFNINRHESTRHLFYHCNLLSASFKIDLLQLTLLFSQVNSPNCLIFTCVNVLKYDCSMRSLMFKYNVSYNTNIVNLNSFVWDKFCEYCAL